MAFLDDLQNVLNAVGPILAATAAIIAGLIAIAKNAKRFRLLFASDQTPLIVELRLLAETRQEMITTLTEQLAAERAANLKLTEERDFAQNSSDESERRLNDFRDRVFLEHRP